MPNLKNAGEDAVRKPHITVCVCAYKRPELLEQLLDAVGRQQTDGRFTHSIVVADNDAERSSEAVVKAFATRSTVSVVYRCEQERNIARARNTALRNATGEYVAFIDDDEVPVEQWLVRLLAMLEDDKLTGALGPVRPHFPEPPPEWVIKGGFCERPEHPTGMILEWNQCRSGNVLLRRADLAHLREPFDPKFGNGGEDMEFFRQMANSGRVFAWCNEAVAYETVPLSRLSRRFMLRRALLRGKNILKHGLTGWKYLAVSLVAVPVYSVILPIVAVRGQHTLMKYGIKLCDHAGRLLAALNVNPVSERGA